VRLPRRLGYAEEAELVDHLGELRARSFIALGAVAFGSVAGYLVHARVIEAFLAALPEGHRRLVTLGVTEPFVTSLKVSIAIGFALALPIVLRQVWSFLAPALDRSIRRAIAWLTVSAAGLLAIGVAFGYLVALPAALRFLVGFDAAVYDVQIRAADYISFALLTMVACGVVFELPVVVLGLVRMGVLSSAKLRRSRRLGYFLVVLAGVALPGVDPVTTVIETLPLLVVYEASIWLSVLFERRWAAMRPVLDARA
jgi:sec-independent protein translocase protein TatC